MIAWFYENAKTHMLKHSRMYSSFQLDIGSEDFKQVFVTHRNAVTTAMKKTLQTIGCYGRKKEEMLREDVGRNLTLSLHSSFSVNIETVNALHCCKQRVEEQWCCRTA